MKRKYLSIGQFKKSGFVVKANKIIGYLRRDINDLKVCNITDQEITDLKTQADTAAALMNESQTIGKRKEAVKAKTQSRDGLMSLVLQTKATLTHYYGANESVEHFQVKGVSLMTDTEFVAATGDFIQSLQANTDAQKNGGITTAVLNALVDARQNFVDAIDQVNAINIERSVQTRTRKETFENVYSKIALLADIAKTYWQSKNDSRYFDYVLMPRSKSNASPPSPTPAATANTTTNPVANAETPIATNNTVA